MLTKKAVLKLKPGNQIEIGDMILVCEKGLKHAIDRLIQASTWHHVMLYIGKGKVLEVTPMRGCRITALEPKLAMCHSYKVLRHRRITKNKAKKLVADSIRLFLWKKFSMLQLFKIILSRRLNLISRFRKKSIYLDKKHKCDIDRVVCSNMISMAYYISGLLVSDSHLPEYVVPKDYSTAKSLRTVLEFNNHK